MIRILIAFILLLEAAQANNALFIDLTGPWRIALEDKPEYARPDFDDSSWDEVRLPASLRRRDYWLRRRVALPEGTDLARLALTLGTLHDEYEVYINGNQIGASDGTFAQPRTFSIPEIALAGRDGAVTIAVRVQARSGPIFWSMRDRGPYRLTYQGPAADAGGRDQVARRAWDASPLLAWSAVAFLVAGVTLLGWTTQKSRVELLWFAMYAASCGVSRLLLFLGIDSTTHPFQALGLPQFHLATGLLSDPLLGEFVMSAFQAPFRKWIRIALWTGFLFSCIRFFVYDGGLFQFSPGPFVSSAVLLGALLWSLYSGRKYRLDWPEWLLRAAILLQGLSGLEDFLTRRSLGVRNLFPLTFRVDHFLIDRRDVLSLVLTLLILIILLVRIREDLRQKQRLATEMEAAATVQKLLIPTVSGSGVEAVYLPAQEVGGDFWHLLDDRLLVVGDVSGKGLKAAMIVSLITGMLDRRHAQTPAALLAELNAALVARMDGGFVTVCVARLDGDTVTLANAGHPAPYLDGQEVALESGLPLGIDADAEYTEVTLPLTGRLTFLSDGIPEAANAKGELFGFDRSRELVSRPVAQIAEAARAWGQTDDITVVAIERPARKEAAA